MIWGAMRNFNYGSEEAVQQSKKGGKGGDESASEPKGAAKKGGKGGEESASEPKGAAKKGGKRGASVSLSSPERSRKSKIVEGISMLASTEASKTRRGTQYGSPVSSLEKVTRRGTPYGGSTPSPRQSKKQKVTGVLTVSPPPGNSKNKQVVEEEEECPQKETNEEEEFGNIEDDAHSSQAQASPWKIPQSSQASQGQASQTRAWEDGFRSRTTLLFIYV
ncbi:hypothetical protein IGI04_014782 [Brassica rapa subsp. trilocularis]|uniref:Uncharacterized protein n=1 Tax=Brassica rapa subsp. trilocularis TaxID=1813537 RepID=A0ABQ7MNU2_BRACM|nr:hypothetical protein IGI04_014782 [Brassica rapa subsp. trilocularis]